MQYCCGCFSNLFDRNKSVHRAKYNETDYTIEFENLIEEEDFYEPVQHSVTDVEKEFLKRGRYDELLSHQNKINEQQDELLRRQEEDVKLEDEAFIQAKKEAAKSRKVKQSLDKSSLMKARTFNSVEFSKWLAEEKIDVTSSSLDVEDFDTFMEKVKAKSAKALNDSVIEDEDRFEQALKRGFQATVIAGDALNALQPVELHAVEKELHEGVTNQGFATENESKYVNKEECSEGYWSSTSQNSSSSNALSTSAELNVNQRGNTFKNASPKTPNITTTKAIISTPKNVASNLNPEVIIKDKDNISTSIVNNISSVAETTTNYDEPLTNNGKLGSNKGTKEVCDDPEWDNDFGFDDGDDDFVSDDGDFEELLV